MLKNLHNTYWLFGILIVLSLNILGKGCNREDHNQHLVSPEGTHPRTIYLRIGGGSNARAKATGITVKLVGLDEDGNPAEPVIETDPILAPSFPLSVPITVFVPPCRYQVTVTATLTRDPAQIASAVLDMCQSSPTVDISINTFEAFQIGENPIQAPGEVDAGETISVSCGTSQISAPDSDRAPLSATLSEWGGESISGPFDASTSVSGSFPDPFPDTSAVDRRVFTCTIADGRSASQTFEKTVTRISQGFQTFTGTFVADYTTDYGNHYRSVATLWQDGNVLTGTLESAKTCFDCDCTAIYSIPVTGTVINETTAVVSTSAITATCTGSGGCSCTNWDPAGSLTLILKDNGRILQGGDVELIRQ